MLHLNRRRSSGSGSSTNTRHCNLTCVIGLKALLAAVVVVIVVAGVDTLPVSCCCSHQTQPPPSTGRPDDLHIFEANAFPNATAAQPTLANGHIGFTVFSDTVYLNGVYNGRGGLSHRARIPNWANLRVEVNGTTGSVYRLNVRDGVFETIGGSVDEGGNAFGYLHRVYAHRYYTRAIVNEVHIWRVNGSGAVTVRLRQSAGNRSTEDITFDRIGRLIIGADNLVVSSHCGYTNEAEYDDDGGDDGGGNDQQVDDGNPRNNDDDEDDAHRGTHQPVCVLWNHVPEEITLGEDVQVTSARFVMTVDGRLSVAKREIMSVLATSLEALCAAHVAEWRRFWTAQFNVQIDGDAELMRVIYASVFAIVSSLPSRNSSQPSAPFGGLSPTGLPKGGADRLQDYEGHSMWDTEMWQLPVVLLIDGNWSETVLDYRFERLAAARRTANATGLRGARFPWESAHTGRDVTQPCCPIIARDQLHISADIAFALRQHWAATRDMRWLQRRGCPMAVEIARFWADRVELNRTSGLFEILGVMGPDEDHDGVANNAYTNVAVGLALFFADYCNCLLNTSSNFSAIAAHLKLPYDARFAYTPQFDGYRRGTVIKQADTVLIGYPLLYTIGAAANASAAQRAALRNNVVYYESVLRATGPAMTWSMYAVNRMQLEARSPDDERRADALFRQGYRAYVRPPFMVWNELIEGIAADGAQNFVTGAGGFLQSLLAGYAGLKVCLDGMHVDRPRLPPNVRRLSLTGIRYVGSKFRLQIDADGDTERALLECVELRAPLCMRFANGTQLHVHEGQEYDVSAPATAVIHPCKQQAANDDDDAAAAAACPLPTDLIGRPIAPKYDDCE